MSYLLDSIGFDMNIVELLANVLILTMIGTLSVGLVAYFAYKIRELRRPVQSARTGPSPEKPVFVSRYVPKEEDFAEEAASSARQASAAER